MGNIQSTEGGGSRSGEDGGGPWLATRAAAARATGDAGGPSEPSGGQQQQHRKRNEQQQQQRSGQAARGEGHRELRPSAAGGAAQHPEGSAKGPQAAAASPSDASAGPKSKHGAAAASSSSSSGGSSTAAAPRQRRSGGAAAAGGAPTAEPMDGGVLSFSGTIQAVGGVLITLLTIHKLVEEVRVIRALRRGARSGGLDGGGGGGPGTGPDGRERGDDVSSEARLLPPLGSDSTLGTFGGAATAAAAGAAAGGADAAASTDSWARISGLREVKVLLQEATVLPLLRPDLFGGVREPPRGVLLYGPPGTGKTMLARAVAAESGATFIPVTGSSILSKWYGESESNVRKLFEEARRTAPAVIFIDEVDSLLGRRAGASGGGDGPGGASEASRRVTNEFLSFIDGIHTASAGPSSTGRVVVIAATNAPWELDEAALSRFAARVLVPLPDAAARSDILRAAMAGVACSMSDADWRAVAEATGSYSGRDLMQVCREAAMQPLRELWGGRVLEGGAPRHAQRQRQLVIAVAAALRRGVPRRRMRRELDKWKRAEPGAAAWCDIDAVISEAEGMNSAGGACGGAAGGKTPRLVGGPEQGVKGGAATSLKQQQEEQQQEKQQQQGGGSDAGSTAGDAEFAPAASRAASCGPDTPGSPAAAAGTATTPGGKGSPTTAAATWTVEELLALPADALRPVCHADFDAALKSVASTDIDGLAARFEEWAARYGSGGGARRREDGWRALPMYV